MAPRVVFILMFSLLSGCTARYEQRMPSRRDNVEMDLDLDSDAKKALHQRLSSSFAEGQVVDLQGRNGTIIVRELGLLEISSGAVVACDPLVDFATAPFSISVPVGKYRVYMSVVKTEEEERVAFAKMQIGQSPTVSWKMAVVRGDNTGERSFYPVDSGTGSFMDARTLEIVRKKLDSEMDGGDYAFSDSLIRSLDENKVIGLSWADFYIPEAQANIVAFTSGWGDGSYNTYFGFDSNGKLSELITDFEVLP